MTTIRVLLITSDDTYCHRLTAYFGKHHPEIKFSIMNNSDNIQGLINQKTYNVVLVGDEYSGVSFSPLSNVACCFISVSSSEMLINGIKSFCKYKSGEEIYRRILDLYSEVSTGNNRVGDSDKKIFAFVGANGGAGATTIAAAFCFKLAQMGKSVLYFSCDKFSDNSLIFNAAASSGNLSDLFFAVKSSEGKNINLPAKASSLLKNDTQNVMYFDSCKNPLDFDGATPKLLKKIIDIAIDAKNFDCVVIDGSIYDGCYSELLKSADRIVLVSENSPAAQSKLKSLLSYWDVLDKRNSQNLSDRTYVVLNKDKGAGANGVSIENVKLIGTVPKYKDTVSRAICNAVARLDMWNSFMADSSGV